MNQGILFFILFGLCLGVSYSQKVPLKGGGKVAVSKSSYATSKIVASNEYELGSNETNEINGSQSTNSLIIDKNMSISESNSIDAIKGDNTLAVSNKSLNNDTIVAMKNAKIIYYSMNGVVNLVASQTLKSFYNDTILKNGYFGDPKILYDTDSNKYVLCYEQWKDTTIGGVAKRFSCLYVFASKTSNPMDGWIGIRIPEDSVGHDSLWIDRPDIGMSRKEIFICANLHKDGGGHKKLMSIALTKQELYSWTSTVFIRKFSINDPNANNTNNLKNTFPISGGAGGNYGPGIYLMHTNLGSSGVSDSVWLYDITKDISSDSFDIVRKAFKVNYYDFPFLLHQQGTSIKMVAGLTRIADAFYYYPTIHYVYPKKHNDTLLNSQISYNRLDLNTNTNIEKTYVGTDYGCAYPSLSYFASIPNKKSVLISFLTSGKTSYPSFRCIAIDDTLGFSNELMIRQGDTYLTTGGQNWGDYTGTVRKHNAITPTAWTYGTYTSLGGFTGTYRYNYSFLAEIIQIGIANSISLLNANQDIVNVYPNPTNDKLFVDISKEVYENVEIEFYDLQGKLIEVISANHPFGTLKEGVDTKNMSKGVYLLAIKTKSKKLIGYEKVVLY